MAEIQVHGGLVTPHAPVVLVSSGPAYFDPLVFPGCVLWLRSDLGITLNGSTVSAWADQSGQGNNVTQGTAANQPTYTVADAAYNGRPTLVFNGTSSFMNGALAVAQPDTIIVVANGTNASQAQIVDAAASANRQAVFDDGTGNLDAFAGSSLPGATTAFHSPSVIAAVLNGASSAIYINNSQAALASGAAGANSMGDMSIGSFHGTGNFWNGKTVELMVYNFGLTPSQRLRVFQYLGSRYGISVS